MTKIKDTHDDTLTIDSAGLAAQGKVRVEIDYNAPGRARGTTALYVILTKDRAIEAAQALIEAAGYEAKLATPADLFGADDEDERAGWNIYALTAAAEYGRTADFTYTKPDGVQSARVLEVEDVHTSKRGDTLVTGYDQTQGEPRVFRLDRIVGYVTIR